MPVFTAADSILRSCIYVVKLALCRTFGTAESFTINDEETRSFLGCVIITESSLKVCASINGDNKEER